MIFIGNLVGFLDRWVGVSWIFLNYHPCWEAHSIFNLLGFFYFFFLLSLLSSGLSHNVLFWFQVKCLCGYGWYFKMDDDSVIYTAVVLCGGILGTDRETAAFNK